jgi:hypothetical protein
MIVLLTVDPDMNKSKAIGLNGLLTFHIKMSEPVPASVLCVFLFMCLSMQEVHPIRMLRLQLTPKNLL